MYLQIKNVKCVKKKMCEIKKGECVSYNFICFNAQQFFIDFIKIC